MPDETRAYLEGLEYVGGRLGNAERIEEFLRDASEQASAAVQLVRAESSKTPPWVAAGLGGSWNVPIDAVDEKLAELTRRVEAIDTSELLEASQAAAALSDEIDRLSVDLKSHLSEEVFERA
jgi:hypothetical protein